VGWKMMPLLFLTPFIISVAQELLTALGDHQPGLTLSSLFVL